MPDDIVFWFKGVPYATVCRQAVAANNYHAKLTIAAKGARKTIIVALKPNGGCAWNAHRINLPKFMAHGLPKAKSCVLTDKSGSLKKRPD